MQDNDSDPEQTTALLQRDALLGLIDQTVERERSKPHTVPRERVRARGSSRHVEIVDVAPLAPQRPRDERDTDEPTLSPWLVLAVISLLIFTFIAATQLR